MTTTKKTGVSFRNYSTRAMCSKAQPYTVTLPDGAEIVLMVMGEHSDVVRDSMNEEARKDNLKNKMLEKSGRSEREPSLDELIRNNNRLIAQRVVGWSGFEEEFSAENAEEFFFENRDVPSEVLAFSRDVGNFTKPQ